MTVHSRLKSFSFAKLVHYCTKKYLCIHLSQVYVDSSTQDVTYMSTSGSLAYAPSAGGLGGVRLTRVIPSSGGPGGVPVQCNSVWYLLGCATGRLWWFLLTMYPETMPPRIPVFSHFLLLTLHFHFQLAILLITFN
jgi:hypothetical protein